MSLNTSANLQHGVKTNTTPVVCSYHLTECKQKRLFAYTAVFDKRARIASNGLSYGFGHFFEEMSLNRMHVESQQVTAAVLRQKVSNGKW